MAKQSVTHLIPVSATATLPVLADYDIQVGSHFRDAEMRLRAELAKNPPQVPNERYMVTDRAVWKVGVN